jgi:hypothetical protein
MMRRLWRDFWAAFWLGYHTARHSHGHAKPLSVPRGQEPPSDAQTAAEWALVTGDFDTRPH